MNKMVKYKEEHEPIASCEVLGHRKGTLMSCMLKAITRLCHYQEVVMDGSRRRSGH